MGPVGRIVLALIVSPVLALLAVFCLMGFAAFGLFGGFFYMYRVVLRWPTELFYRPLFWFARQFRDGLRLCGYAFVLLWTQPRPDVGEPNPFLPEHYRRS